MSHCTLGNTPKTMINISHMWVAIWRAKEVEFQRSPSRFLDVGEHQLYPTRHRSSAHLYHPSSVTHHNACLVRSLLKLMGVELFSLTSRSRCHRMSRRFLLRSSSPRLSLSSPDLPQMAGPVLSSSRNTRTAPENNQERCTPGPH